MDNPVIAVVAALMTMPEVQGILLRAAEFGEEVLDEGEKIIKRLVETDTDVS